MWPEAPKSSPEHWRDMPGDGRGSRGDWVQAQAQAQALRRRRPGRLRVEEGMQASLF